MREDSHRGITPAAAMVIDFGADNQVVICDVTAGNALSSTYVAQPLLGRKSK